jgi:hypothetical protein
MKKIRLIVVSISLLQLQAVKCSVAASICMLRIESQRREAGLVLAALEKKIDEQENIDPNLTYAKKNSLEHDNNAANEIEQYSFLIS